MIKSSTSAANALLVCMAALVLCAGTADNSPSEHEARTATAASVQDGQEAEQARLKSVAAQAHRKAVTAKKSAQESALASTQLAAAQ